MMAAVKLGLEALCSGDESDLLNSGELRMTYGQNMPYISRKTYVIMYKSR